MPETSFSWDEEVKLIKKIVSEAQALKDSRTKAIEAKVSYCCVFSQNEEEFAKFRTTLSENGLLAKETETGPIFVVAAIPTVSGHLRVVKIRKPDHSRKERGDADFSLNNYSEFKKTYLGKEGFKLVERPEFEMIELVDKDFDVRVYFSNPPVEEHPGIREALLADSGGRNA